MSRIQNSSHPSAFELHLYSIQIHKKCIHIRHLEHHIFNVNRNYLQHSDGSEIKIVYIHVIKLYTQDLLHDFAQCCIEINSMLHNGAIRLIKLKSTAVVFSTLERFI